MTSRDLINHVLGLAGCRLEKRARTRLQGRDLHEDIGVILGRKSGCRIFDVGANEGQSIRHFLRDFSRPRIVAFEPGPRASSLLAQKFAGHPDVRIVAKAVGETEGEGELDIYADSQMNSLLPLEGRSADAARPVLERQRVEIISLDGFAAREGIEAIDLLKLDCQGSEMAILRGASSLLREGRVKCLYLEVMFKPLYKSQARLSDYAGFLQSLGFDLTGFYKPAFRGTALFHADVLFTRREAGGNADPVSL